MGTRSIIKVMDNNKPLVCIYRQMDGYPEGMGKELVKFCKDRVITTGWSPCDTRTISIGMGCFAASLIGHLKGDIIGNVYIYPSNTTASECGAEYEYIISNIDGHLKIICIDVDKHSSSCLYDGSLKKVEEVKETVLFDYPTGDGLAVITRKIGVIQEDDKYIAGKDLNQDNMFKKFRKDKIVGKIYREDKD